MGSQPSKPSHQLSQHEKAVIDCVTELRIDEDYIEVATEKPGRETVQLHPRSPGGVDPIASNEFIRQVLNDPKNRLALTALSTANPRQVLMSSPVAQVDQQIFSHGIPFEGNPITSQGASGRCWLFAATNVFRIAFMQKYGLESFELSQSYLFFWDKFEKTNWFLEQIIATSQEDIGSRLVQQLLTDLIGDGGQMSMVQGLVAKYGLVPKTIYPDNWNATNSAILNSILKTKLRQNALTLRRLLRGELAADPTPAAVEGFKAAMLQEALTIMTLLLGPPPSSTESFSWDYLDKSGKSHKLSISPKDFARDTYGSDIRVSLETLDGMISLVHDPRHKPMSLLTVDRLGNIVGGRKVEYVNVDMDTLKTSCVRMIKAGMPVFFGCDVGQFSDKDLGVMDTELFNYQVGINTNLLGMNKAERLMTGESRMTHAMVLTAVHIDEATGQPVRWRVQNSWGPTAGDKGWFVMTDAWMDEFVYQAVIDPRLCPRAVRDVLKQEPVTLPLWDPMGSLAMA
ncbi:hypothetical protein LMH87_002264 [Akanthomyces muscarius]|uniref:Cysteine proteinase 1, mitochondrial n=1 Tax=Akanthomyces muscarius TaxID=2231603 RepID=A0A9W8UJH0_AKAMU|nr:hypothetical protein LMH87_002264 [Akanthomyces muscarius]KAJ4147758.1 hypothetical protein LMH87_002264 [Akanthomyces muscarius]